jgi:cytochrome c-type biogenesis protein CcmF
VVGLIFPVIYGGEFNLLVSFGIILAMWVFLVVVKDITNQYRNKVKPSRSHWGMAIAHAGIAVSIVGVTIVSNYESETNVRMAVNESVEVSGYQIEFKGIKHVEGPNYSAEQGQLNVYKVNPDGENDFVALLKPERRAYKVQTMGMTEAGIDGGLFRDVYVALGDPLENGAWAIRVHYKPFVRWIWLGALFMALGGILSMLDKRYRAKRTSRAKQEANYVQVKPNVQAVSELS